MKKVFMLAMVAFMTLAMSQKAQAIENPNPKGTMVLGLHAGYYPGFGANATFDYTLVDSWWKGHFTVGGYAGFNYTPYAGMEYHYSNFAVMPRATYGLNITKDFEVHAGLMAGWAFQTWPAADRLYHGFIQGEVVGCRYMFTPNFGVEAEMVYNYNYNGINMSYFNVGVTFKL